MSLEQPACTQGALNAQAIKSIDEKTDVLRKLFESTIINQNSIMIEITEIKTIQKEEREHRKTLDKKLTENIESLSKELVSHVSSSDDRINKAKEEVKADTVKQCRSDMLWFLGVPAMCLTVLLGLFKFLKGG